MRFGLRARIVATIVGILAIAFLVTFTGSLRLTTRVLAPDVAAPSAAPIAQKLVTWFAQHHSWANAEAFLRQIAPEHFAIVVLDGDELRASSVPELRRASVMYRNGDLLIAPRTSSSPQAYAISLRFQSAPSANIVVQGRQVGTVAIIPSMAALPARMPDAPTAGFRQRFLVLFAATAAAAILIALLLATSIVRPIRELTLAAQTASASAVPSVSAKSPDELGDLARAFNALGERVVQSEVARRNLVSDVAHELRTPLTNVRCALESFQDGIDEPTPQALASVLADVVLLQRLVTDLHELSVGHEQPQIDRISTNIEEEARSAVAAFSERAAARDVRIEVVSQVPMPAVPCDPARVRQVFHNLIENALRYGRAGGRVTVTMTHELTAVRVTVSDDGDGFPVSEETAIFERLHRIDASRSRETGGAGLGLAIVKQLVENHGGLVGATGGEGRGASVWFTLPFGSGSA